MPAITKVIIDVNIWVNYCTNGRIANLVNLPVNFDVVIYTSSDLLNELEEVLQRPSPLKKLTAPPGMYMEVIKNISLKVKPLKVFNKSPDKDDNYLFDLALHVDADYMITSDNALLNFNESPVTIIHIKDFKKVFPFE
jgi:putative PIN family toxin of toxin-antitoxin system